MTNRTRAAACLMAALAALILLGPPAGAQDSAAGNEAAPTDTLRTAGPDVELGAEEGAVRVFGGNMFTGRFSQQPFTGFNPEYQVMIGDNIRVQFWGAVDLAETLAVDAQGNIFIPGIGPIQVLGVRNVDLTPVIESQVKQVYRDRVGVYANLESSQPVSVIVSGFVRRPGMYRGLSSDSVLYFLYLAGGIDLNRGSFLDIRVMRGGALRSKVNLYDFLLRGELPPLQFVDGDTIHVGPIANTVTVEGAAHNTARFEFDTPEIAASTVLGWADPKPEATHVRVRRSASGDTTAEYLPLIAVGALSLKPGDAVTLVPEERRETVVVTIDGEHDGAREIALPQGSKLADILPLLVPNPRSNVGALQLFRVSVKKRQKELLNQSLDQLEQEVLLARSATDEEAALRLKEAELIQKFIARARTLEPQGFVVLGESEGAKDIYLEDDDVLFIPKRSNVIALAGEVMFPTSVAYTPGDDVEDYIEKAGGFTRNADESRILLRRANGEIETLSTDSPNQPEPQPGDEVMVLSEPNVKNLQLAKTLAEVFFRIAVATRLATGL